MNTYSQKENDFFSIISNIKCLSMQQAHYILKKYLGCNKNEADAIIRHSITYQRTVLSQDGNFLLLRNQQIYSKINLSTVRAFTICLGIVEDLDCLKYTYIPAGLHELVFYSDRLYKVIELRANNLTKVTAIQQEYIDATRDNSSNMRQSISPLSYVTIFLIPQNEDREEIERFFETADVFIPSLIIFMEDSGIENIPAKHEMFSLNMD